MPCKTLMGLVASLALWIFGILAGFSLLQHYSLTAGPAEKADFSAHAIVNAHRTPGRPLLIMAVHPRCPCTDSSLAELGDLLARSQGDCDALLLQFEPTNANAGWPRSASPRQLGGVNVPVIVDRGGRIGAAIGAATSGHTVFVDAQGEVRFQGGLTVARDHRGHSPGQDAILAVLRGGDNAISSAPVYGCTFGAECRAEVTR
jgi:hypothetical protein